MRLLTLLMIFLNFSCKKTDPAEVLPDTKFYIQDEVDLKRNEAFKVREIFKNHITNKYNSDKEKPRVASTAFYLVKNHPMKKYGQRIIILTNFVNERSRKHEFDNMELYEFISKNISQTNRGVGGSQKDFQNDNYELLFKDTYVTLPVDSSWLIEDPAKISLFHNDYEVQQKITINGFDKDGEPEIQITADGSLSLVFNFMPPSNGKDSGGELGEFETFDKFLEKELKVKVQWTDREIFYIEKPNPDTAEKLKYILENYWKKE